MPRSPQPTDITDVRDAITSHVQLLLQRRSTDLIQLADDVGADVVANQFDEDGDRFIDLLIDRLTELRSYSTREWVISRML